MPERQSEHCMICSSPLLYRHAGEEAICTGCGKTETSAIICPEGHYICNACHADQTLAAIPERMHRLNGSAPEDLLEQLLEESDLPMHGPEHHALAGLAMLAAAERAHISLPEDYIEETIRRCRQIPGGACGYLGACGGAISLGVAVSMVTRATPLSGLARGLANRASAAALERCGDDDARCCKRALRRTIAAGREFFANELGITFPEPLRDRHCRDMVRNQECAGERCPYFYQRPFRRKQ